MKVGSRETRECPEINIHNVNLKQKIKQTGNTNRTVLY